MFFKIHQSGTGRLWFFVCVFKFKLCDFFLFKLKWLWWTFFFAQTTIFHQYGMTKWNQHYFPRLLMYNKKTVNFTYKKQCRLWWFPQAVFIRPRDLSFLAQLQFDLHDRIDIFNYAHVILHNPLSPSPYKFPLNKKKISIH